MVDSERIKEMEAYYERLAPRYESKQGKNVPLSQRHLQYWETLFDCYKEYLTACDIIEVGCGPGTWTCRLAEIAKSITATDYNESTLVEARRKTYRKNNVQFLQADAYDLSGVHGSFNAGFAKDWFSHIPKSKITLFIDVLHNKIGPGGRVVLADTYYTDPRVPETPGRFSHIDEEGNVFHNRRIPDDPERKVWKVIKNCPSEEELRSYVDGRASDIDYCIHDSWEKRRDWCLSYIITK